VNIAFPAVLLFLLVIPGFLFRSRFRKEEATDLDFRPFAHQTVVSIIFASGFHIVWLTLIFYFTNYRVDFALLLALVAGHKEEAGLPLLKKAVDEPLAITAYFLSMFITSYLLGGGLQYLVKWLELDRKGPLASFLKFKTPWYYLFSGLKEEDRKDFDGVYVAAIVALKESAYLYQGLLVDYSVDKNGCLDRMVLRDASRRPFREDYDNNVDSPDADRFYNIAGHYFVLLYEEAITLNVRYIKVEDVDKVAADEIDSSAVVQ